jgi:hypothetical protein
MKKWAYIFCLVILVASCSRILSSKPSGTFSEEQMVDILIDIHLTEATIRIANDSIGRLNDTTDLRKRFARVFSKNDVNPDQFNSSLNYYLEHIELLDNIYKDVIARLSEMDAALQQIKPDTNPDKLKGPYKIRKISTMNNPWFRTLHVPDEPQGIIYFPPSVYPL